MKAMATAVTPCSAKRAAAAATSAGSNGACSTPSARMRPPTGTRRCRGTIGAGGCQKRS